MHTSHEKRSFDKGYKNPPKSGLECANRFVWNAETPLSETETPWRENSIFYTTGGVGGQSCTLGWIKSSDPFDQPDGSDGDQILLF